MNPKSKVGGHYWGWGLAWPRSWNFMGRKQMKFNIFIHLDEHTERICLFLVRQLLDVVPPKIWHFQISKSNFGVKYNSIFLKPKFWFEYQIRRPTFIYFSSIFVKLYFVKMCRIFTSSLSNCLTRYKQILPGCTFGCKNALTFARLPIRFHNRGHTSVDAWK